MIARILNLLNQSKKGKEERDKFTIRCKEIHPIGNTYTRAIDRVHPVQQIGYQSSNRGKIRGNAITNISEIRVEHELYYTL